MATADLSPTAPVTTRELPKRSTWGLIQLSLFWVATNYHWAAIPIIILPSQVQVYLFMHHPAGLQGQALENYILNNAGPGLLALVLGPGLLAALISNPLFGYLSDRTRLKWGRRLPYIIIGTLVNVVGLGIMAFTDNIPGLIIGLVIVQLANNAAAAPFHALLPDLVPAQQRGRASGIMGLGQMLGTILGASIPGIVLGLSSKSLIEGKVTFAQYHQTLLLAYGFSAVFILALALATVLTVKERPLAERNDMPAAAGLGNFLTRDLIFTVVGMLVAIGATIGVMNLIRVDLGSEQAQNVLIFPALIIGTLGVAKAFDFRPRQHGDFAWVLITRAFVTMGIYTVLSFIQFYLEHVFQGVPNAPAPETAAGYFLDITIILAAVSTGFAGALSDRFGRKRMVYVSGAFMVIVGLLFVLAQFATPSLLILVTFAGAAIFGLGYGAYVSVDWALVTDVLPNEDSYARDMGIWNVALTLPQVLAYLIGSFVIVLFSLGGAFAISGQPNFGYTMLFVLLVIYALVGTVTVRFIRGVKR
jgi:MFS family permease